MKIILPLLLTLIGHVALAEKLAITFDDLPLNGSLPAGMTEVDIVKAVLPILKATGGPPAYGFINARKLEGNRKAAEALRLWVSGGQLVANHTYSHLDLTKSTPAEFRREILMNEPALRLLSTKDDWRYFRYPYLHEGDTLEKRHEVRAMLRGLDYSIAQVTLDHEDYLWNSAYARCLDKKDEKAIAWLRSSYLQTAEAYFQLQRQLAQQVYGREINHVLLLHLGAFSSEILPDLFKLLARQGFTLVSLEEAQRDPAYSVDPDFAATNTGTLLEQLMDARKLTYPQVPPKPRIELAEICQ